MTFTFHGMFCISTIYQVLDNGQLYNLNLSRDTYEDGLRLHTDTCIKFSFLAILIVLNVYVYINSFHLPVYCRV